MSEVTPRYTCPDCGRGILNRRITRCLYCGATLPQNVLLSKEQIAELDRQKEEKKRRPETSSQNDGSSIDSALDLGDVIDVAIDIVSDLGSFFD